MRFDYVTKFLLIAGAALSVSVVSVQNLRAQTGASGTGGSSQIALLQQIANNTYNILQQVSNLQTILTNVGQVALAWLTPDTSQALTTALEPNFNNLGTLLNNDLQQQLGMQSTITNTILNTTNGVSQSNANYANDLVYSSVLGQPYWSQDPRAAGGKSIDYVMNYILNASGSNIVHVVPGYSWQGAAADQTRYQNYFNTAIAVESFNAYVLSAQYADKNQYNTLQSTLLTQASDPQNWIAQVASENIGWVLRQLLLFQSQAFVLLSQMVQSEKQIATAMVMTNALILTLNQQWEEGFVSKAQASSS